MGSSIRNAARALVDHLKGCKQEVLQESFEEVPAARRFVLIIDRETWDLIVDLERALDAQPREEKG